MALLLTTPAGAQASPFDAVVFFDWGKLEISRDAAVTLDKLVGQAVAQPDRMIRLDGYSDRSGPSGVNQRISLQRARLVRDYLVGKGIASARVEAIGHGEQQPLVATDDGVREVQNRRVEIRLVGGNGNGGSQ